MVERNTFSEVSKVKKEVIGMKVRCVGNGSRLIGVPTEELLRSSVTSYEVKATLRDRCASCPLFWKDLPEPGFENSSIFGIKYPIRRKMRGRKCPLIGVEIPLAEFEQKKGRTT